MLFGIGPYTRVKIVWTRMTSKGPCIWILGLSVQMFKRYDFVVDVSVRVGLQILKAYAILS